MTDREATDRVAPPETPGPGSEASRIGARLDEHHAPETNGRMSICRRCGSRTSGPHGRHAPHERQLERIGEWLDQQSRLVAARSFRERRDT